MGWQFIKVGPCLYRKSEGGTIYLRVRQGGKRLMRSTETTNPAQARQFHQRWRDEERAKKYGQTLPGPSIQEKCLSVGTLINEYVNAGYPTKKMKKKAPATIDKERLLLRPLREFFGDKNPATLTLADCDAYREWRNGGGYVTLRPARGKGKLNPREYHTKGGDRIVDMDLDCLSNVLHLARRRNKIRFHPLVGRGKFTSASEIRHCREVAPTPEGLAMIESWFRDKGEHDMADVTCFLAFSGLRISEALHLTWQVVRWDEEIIDVNRKKRGIFPWVPILPEMKQLLVEMRMRLEASGTDTDLLFPSPFDPSKYRDHSAYRRRLAAACKALEIGHVTPHGLRSYFVTQAREGGLTDAEIAMLIGDKSGPTLIASTYGDVRSEHLVRQAQRIRLRVSVEDESNGSGLPKGLPTKPTVTADNQA